MDMIKANTTITITLPALALMAVHGNTCLGLRHPKNSGPSRKLAEEFVSMIERKLVEVGLLNEDDIKEIHRTERQESRREYILVDDIDCKSRFGQD